MGDHQEETLFQELQEEDDICNSMLHLSTAAHHHPAAACFLKTTMDSVENCNSTYGHCTKRHSSLSFQEPSPKRPTHRPPSSPSTTAAEYQLLGFTKLPLPHSFPSSTPSPLRRTVSEPIYSIDAVNCAASPRPSPISKQPQQELGNTVQESFSLPNAAPFIHRTMSDPKSLANQHMPAVGGTPPRPPARNVSGSPSLGDSPSTKRLRRMKERIKEMSQWWNQVVRDSDEEDNTDNTSKGESENEMENPSQEAVWVEKNGECLVLHFRCPCGNGYQILLSGKNCYYKLTAF